MIATALYVASMIVVAIGYAFALSKISQALHDLHELQRRDARDADRRRREREEARAGCTREET